MPAKKPSPPRLPAIPAERLTPAQAALVDSIRSGPRGQATQIRGPFAVFLHSPDYGQLAQQLGGYCRLKTNVPPGRLWPPQDEGAAAAVRIRHPAHRQAVAVAIRVVHTRAACRARRGEPAD